MVSSKSPVFLQLYHFFACSDLFYTLFKGRGRWKSESVIRKNFLKIFVKNTFLGVILCEKSIPRIPEAWKRFLDPDSGNGWVYWSENLKTWFVATCCHILLKRTMPFWRAVSLTVNYDRKKLVTVQIDELSNYFKNYPFSGFLE